MFKRVHKAGFFAMSVITVGDQAVGHLVGRHPSENGRIRATRSSGVCRLPFQAALLGHFANVVLYLDDQRSETQGLGKWVI